MSGGPWAALGPRLLVLGLVLGPVLGPASALGPPPAPAALQHDSRGVKHGKMLVPHPSLSSEVSAADAAGATAHASQTTPSRSEAAKEEETLKSLLDVLRQAMRDVPTQEPPAQPPAPTPTPNSTTSAPWLKVDRKPAKKQQNLKNLAMKRKPAPSTTPSGWTLHPDPGVSVGLCGYESPQLLAALKEFALIIQTAAKKKNNKMADELIKGFSEVFEECFKKMNVAYHN